MAQEKYVTLINFIKKVKLVWVWISLQGVQIQGTDIWVRLFKYSLLSKEAKTYQIAGWKAETAQGTALTRKPAGTVAFPLPVFPKRDHIEAASCLHVSFVQTNSWSMPADISEGFHMAWAKTPSSLKLYQCVTGSIYILFNL